MNEVFNQKRGFSYKGVSYGDTDSMYIHKKDWSDLVDNRFVRKSLGLGKNDYGNCGMFYTWFLAPKIKYCLVIVDYGVLPAKRTFESYGEGHRMIKPEKYIWLTGGKTVSGRFSID